MVLIFKVSYSLLDLMSLWNISILIFWCSVFFVFDLISDSLLSMLTLSYCLALITVLLLFSLSSLVLLFSFNQVCTNLFLIIDSLFQVDELMVKQLNVCFSPFYVVPLQHTYVYGMESISQNWRDIENKEKILFVSLIFHLLYLCVLQLWCMTWIWQPEILFHMHNLF